MKLHNAGTDCKHHIKLEQLGGADTPQISRPLIRRVKLIKTEVVQKWVRGMNAAEEYVHQLPLDLGIGPAVIVYGHTNIVVSLCI